MPCFRRPRNFAAARLRTNSFRSIRDGDGRRAQKGSRRSAGHSSRVPASRGSWQNDDDTGEESQDGHDREPSDVSSYHMSNGSDWDTDEGADSSMRGKALAQADAAAIDESDGILITIDAPSAMLLRIWIYVRPWRLYEGLGTRAVEALGLDPSKGVKVMLTTDQHYTSSNVCPKVKWVRQVDGAYKNGAVSTDESVGETFALQWMLHKRLEEHLFMNWPPAPRCDRDQSDGNAGCDGGLMGGVATGGGAGSGDVGGDARERDDALTRASIELMAECAKVSMELAEYALRSAKCQEQAQLNLVDERIRESLQIALAEDRALSVAELHTRFPRVELAMIERAVVANPGSVVRQIDYLHRMEGWETTPSPSPAEPRSSSHLVKQQQRQQQQDRDQLDGANEHRRNKSAVPSLWWSGKRERKGSMIGAAAPSRTVDACREGKDSESEDASDTAREAGDVRQQQQQQRRAQQQQHRPDDERSKTSVARSSWWRGQREQGTPAADVGAPSWTVGACCWGEDEEMEDGWNVPGGAGDARDSGTWTTRGQSRACLKLTADEEKNDRMAWLEHRADSNILVRIALLIIDKARNANKNCLVCADPIEGYVPAVPIVCSKDLCVMSSEDMGCGTDVESQVLHRGETVDLLIDLFFMAMAGQRPELGFPLAVQWLGRPAFTTAADTPDVGKILTVLQVLPPVATMKHCIERKCDVESGRLSPLSWELESSRGSATISGHGEDAVHKNDPGSIVDAARIDASTNAASAHSAGLTSTAAAVTAEVEVLPPGVGEEVAGGARVDEDGADLLSPLRKALSRKNPLTYPLLRWLLSANRAHLRPLSSAELIPEILCEKQFMLVTGSAEREAKFQALKREAVSDRPSFFAFHGSGAGNWHGILRLGIRNMSGTKYMSAGKSQGPGIYLAERLSLALGYASRGERARWSNASVKGNAKIVAVCEVINKKGHSWAKSQGVFVVPDDAYVVTRFLLVNPRAGLKNNAVRSRDLTIKI